MTADLFRIIFITAEDWNKACLEDYEAGYKYRYKVTIYFGGQSVDCDLPDFLDYNDEWNDKDYICSDIGYLGNDGTFVCELDNVSAIRITKEYEIHK